MTTITKERLLTIKQWRETYGPGSNVVLPAEEAEELARIALASLEAEPVAWKVTFTQIDREYNTFTGMYSDKAEVERWVRLHKACNFRADLTPLYTAKPVPVTPDGWISRFEEMPDPSSEKRVCAFTPTNHEDMRYRFVPASLFKTVCRDATHWFYILPPVGREEVAGG